MLSRTVFHAVREVAGMGMGNGMVYMDTTLDRLAEDLARFVQAVIEIIGLRHSKYKDALVQLSRTRDGSEPSYWGSSDWATDHRKCASDESVRAAAGAG